MKKKDIKEAGFGKRILAYVIDVLLVVVPTILLFSYVTSTKLFDSMGGKEIIEEATAFQIDSGLYRKNSSDQLELLTFYANPNSKSSGESGPVVQNGYGYDNYFSAVYEFYTSFLPGDHAEKPYKIDDVIINKDGGSVALPASEYYDWSYFCENVLGLPSLSSIKDFSSEDNYGFSFYRYALNDEGTEVDTTKRPVLKTSIQAKVDQGDEETIRNLSNDFYNQSSKSGKYANAVNLVARQSYYQNRAKRYSLLQWVSLLVAFLPIHTAIMLIIPLTNKKCRTIGKFVTGLGVIGIEGYSCKTYQRILHPLIVWLEGCVFLIPSTMIAIMAFFFLSAIDYMASVLSRGARQTIHDKVAHTLVIELKESSYFEDEEEEENYYLEHPEERPGFDEEETNESSSQDSILDMDTLNKAFAEREAALKITNFDEFEKIKGEEFDRLEEMKIKEEAKAEEIEETHEEQKEEIEPESAVQTPPNEDGFTDD